ncbi:uncharacterized protein LOC142344140 [Convolutriloba macropyga]|uniref:uncharacterized protein LOC142344140 n=1 Tax=Convolutriloba macropyga TaxID=536237 RepID=UPI003F527202
MKAMWELRRERAKIEREIMLEDVESEGEREEIVGRQERVIEEREVEEEAEMEEQWEIQRRDIITSFERRHSDMQSSLSSTRSEKMTPLVERKTSLEIRKSDLEEALKQLDTKQTGFINEMDRINSWYELELQKLREQLQSAEDELDNLSSACGRLSQQKTPSELLAMQRNRQNLESIRRDRMHTSKGGQFSKAFIYSYFSQIPKDVWMTPISSQWRRMIRSAAEVPPVRESKSKRK